MSPEELMAASFSGAAADAELIHSGWNEASVQQQYECDAALLLKEEGNKLHGQQQYAAAADKYKRAANNLERHMLGALQQNVMDLLTSCRGNLASCYLQLGRWRECEEQCAAVLHGDATNRKALYRRGQALTALGKHAEAVTDLKAALWASPASERPLIQEKLEEAKRKEKLSAPLRCPIESSVASLLANDPSLVRSSVNMMKSLPDEQLDALLKKTGVNAPGLPPGLKVGGRHVLSASVVLLSLPIFALIT
jgi:tetratricopeptide (TPR) repeat protein